jgi:DNA-binding GntR family transcriptional regulator
VEPFLEASTLTRVSTAEQVAAEIRAILLRGEVPPNTKFPEQALAQRFGVSRNTMREALLLLRSQGLIRHQLHRGAVVVVLDDAAIVDVSQARRVLEQ